MFISPNSYISLSKYGNVAILGKFDTKKLLANLVVLEIISKIIYKPLIVDDKFDDTIFSICKKEKIFQIKHLGI